VDTLVCIKAIVFEPPKVREEGGAPRFERARSAPLVINESDAYAVDQSVLLRKRHGGRISVVSVGPLATQDALYVAQAKGADEALRIDAEPSDPLQVAQLVAALVRQGSYDLILTGIESYDGLASAMGPALAGRLDLPFASAVCGIEVLEGQDRVAVTRELGGGFFSKLEMGLPAVLSVQSGICRLSYPPTVRVLQARRRPPRSITPRALGVELAPASARLVAISPPRREREVEIIEGQPEEIAEALMDRIEGALGS
jgi:electron transfer flavoprotein beta subunit